MIAFGRLWKLKFGISISLLNVLEATFTTQGNPMFGPWVSLSSKFLSVEHPSSTWKARNSPHRKTLSTTGLEQ